MSIPKVKVPITLDKPRTLVLSFNAFCDIQQVLGVNPLAEDEQLDLGSPVNLRAFLWAGLRHEQPDLTLREVGDLLDSCEGGFVAALVGVTQALEAAMPDIVELVENQEASAEGNAQGSQ